MWAWLSSRRSDPPFAISADPRIAFDSTSFRSAFLGLTEAIAVRAGLILLLGEAGSGKTVLLRAVQRAHARSNSPTFFCNARATRNMLPTLLGSLHAPSIPADRESQLQLLAACLARHPAPAVLLIDEADDLSNPLLRDLATLAAWRRGQPDSLQIVLAARPEIGQRLQRADLSDVDRQIIATIHLRGLRPQELAYYVAHHLAIGGRGNVSFEPAALDKLFLYSQGNPIKVNLLCTYALASEKKRIEAAQIEMLAASCGLATGSTAGRPMVGRLGEPGSIRLSMNRSGDVRRLSRRRRGIQLAYRAAAIAGVAGVGFGVIHLFDSAGSFAWFAPADHRLVALLQRPAPVDGPEPAQIQYVAAALALSLPEEREQTGDDATPPDGDSGPANDVAPVADQEEAVPQDATISTPADTASDEPQDAGPESPLPEMVIEQAADPDPGADRSLPPVLEDAPAPAAPVQPAITESVPGQDDAAPQADVPAPEPQQPPTVSAVSPALADPVPPPPAPPVSAVDAVTAQSREPLSGAGAAPPSARSAVRVDAPDVERLMTKGYALLQAGDVASARLFFERAAATGFPEALTAVGQTFDPIELRRRDIIGIKGDPPLALQWYRSAAAAGDPAATGRMMQLSDWMERAQARR